MNDDTFEVRYRKYLLKRLRTLEKDIEKTVAKEKEARKTQIAKLCRYRDTDEAQEAYGYGSITVDEYEEICDVLEKGAAFVEFTKTPKAAALEMLHEFICRQDRELTNFEWEMKSPEERGRIQKLNAEYRASHGLN